jgi:hypothetical protein
MIRAEIGLKNRQIINETFVSWFYKTFTPTTILVTIFHICTWRHTSQWKVYRFVKIYEI